MADINKAVIPIAGFGTRFLPATKALPKAMFPIVDKPVIHYLVHEAVSAGCTEIVFVISKYQDCIKDYFSKHEELEQVLTAKGNIQLLQDLPELINNTKFHYVYQDEQLGDGHAILCAEEYLKDEEAFLVLFGDDLVDPPIAKDLVQIFQSTANSVIALERVGREKISQYGIADMSEEDEGRGKIAALVEKPQPEDAPSNFGVVGKYVCTAAVLAALKNHPTSEDGEIRLIEAFKSLLDTEGVQGYLFSGKRYDIGNKAGFVEATLDFAMKDKDIKKELTEYLRGKLGE